MRGYRAPLIGIRRPIRRRRFPAASFSVTLTGLSTDSLGAYGQIGNHAAIGFTSSVVPDIVKYSASPNVNDAATFGSGPNPTNFDVADGFSVYLHIQALGVWVTRSFPVRYVPGTAPTINNQTFTVGTAITPINASASGSNLTFTYAATSLAAGLSINSSTGSITGTPTAAGSGTATVTPQDQYGRTAEYVATFGFTASLRAQAVGGADLDLSFPEDTAITPTNLIANWNANGNTLSFVSISPALPAGLVVNSVAVMSGTPTTPTADATYTLTMQDEYGRQTSDTFTLQVTEVVAAVNPSITTATFTAGTPATLAINVDYTGADGLRVILAMRNGGSALTPAQMLAGTGTALERFTITPFTNATVNLDSAFTSVSNSATFVDILAREENNGGVSVVSSVPVSGLNFGTGWSISGSSILSSPTVAPPTVSGPNITG